MKSVFSLAAWGRQRALTGQIASEAGRQIGRHLVQRDPERRRDLQSPVELVGQGGLGMAAQAFLGLTTHGFKKGLHLLELGSQPGSRVDGVASIQVGDLGEGVLQRERQQECHQDQHQPLQTAIPGEGVRQFGHGQTGTMSDIGASV
ncbi:hypothetical protein D3C73_1121330 [compost metagenome]